MAFQQTTRIIQETDYYLGDVRIGGFPQEEVSEDSRIVHVLPAEVLESAISNQTDEIRYARNQKWAARVMGVLATGAVVLAARYVPEIAKTDTPSAVMIGGLSLVTGAFGLLTAKRELKRNGQRIETATQLREQLLDQEPLTTTAGSE